MAVQRATVTERSCPLTDPNCVKKVAETFASLRVQPFTPEDALRLIEETVGRYTRGKNVGQLRGWAHIKVCTVGGWYRPEAYASGYALRPGSVVGLEIRDFNGKVLLAA